MAFVLLAIASATEETHRYEDSELITVWTDKVGPFYNPQETYPFLSLGLCELDPESPSFAQVKHRDVDFGETLQGHEFDSSPLIKIQFGRTVLNETVCEMVLTDGKASALEHKIKDNFWYSLYIDDLPTWTLLGEHTGNLGRIHDVAEKIGQEDADINNIVSDMKNNQYSTKIFTHREFKMKKNNDRIIAVNVEASHPEPIAKGAKLTFTYSVTWSETDVTFARRYDLLLEKGFFEDRVHWFSIVNSFMLSLFLVATVAIIIMKTLKRDFSKYALTSQDDDAESLEHISDETGWKQISGDVFRKPSHLLAFTVVYGAGCHMIALVTLALILCIGNSYYSSPGTTEKALVVCYVLTQSVSGYQGGYLYRLHQGKNWKRAMALQCLFVPGIIFVTFCFVNTTALFYKSTMSVPFKTILMVLILFVCFCVPLHGIGTLFGRRAAVGATFPCRVHHLKRPIPARKRGYLVMIAGAGLVPFACVFIETYFLFSSFWSANKVYYVYGFLLAVIVLLSLVLVCVSITCVYLLLNAEDYRWTWHSFLSGASTGVYVYLYAIYYYHSDTKMSGLLQFVYYFGSTFQFCVGFSLFCGALGYFGASKFVHLIYSNVKAD